MNGQSGATLAPVDGVGAAVMSVAVHSVKYEQREHVAVLCVDNPPVNALSHSVRIGLIEGLARAGADDSIEAIVIIGGGRTFMAGADLKEFGRPKDPPELKHVQVAMEASSKPIVSAIHGSALGGGLEVALTGHWRIASATAMLGLPEVKLGLTPGAGGIQRMTRLIGPRAALELILSGEPISAAQALALGVIDELASDNLLDAAVGFAQRVVVEQRPLRVLSHQNDQITEVLPALFDEFQQRIAKSAPGLLAPRKIIECVAAACAMPAAQAFAFDAQCYQQCLDSPQRKAMIHLFFAERAARKIPGASVKQQPIHKVAIIGGSACAQFIAGQLATAGMAVETMACVASAAAVNADMVIACEANDAQMALNLLQALDEVAPTQCLLAFDAPFIDIDLFAAASRHPGRVLGVRFAAQESVTLLECVRGSATSAQAMAGALSLARQLNVCAIASNSRAGSMTDILFRSYLRNAILLLKDGYTPTQVDEVLHNFGMPLGPFEWADLVGLDCSAFAPLAAQSGDDLAVRLPKVIDDMRDRGWLGRKSGQGFYRYDSARPSLNTQVLGLIAPNKSISRTAPDNDAAETILATLFHPLINDGVKALEHKLVQRLSDIDLAFVHAHGFPKYHGGPMFWGETIGLDKLLATVERLSAQHAEAGLPSSLLRRLVTEGKGLSSLLE